MSQTICHICEPLFRQIPPVSKVRP